jgi:hypothetical protein
MKELIVDRIHFSLKLSKLGLAQVKAFHALRNSRSISLVLVVSLKQVLEHSIPSPELTGRRDRVEGKNQGISVRIQLRGFRG